jgi:hypothetical protein
MPDGLRPPEPTLQAIALRYAAGDLGPDEAAAFEARLATDQDARDALSEAVRLSAAALGQEPPRPSPSLRSAIRDRLLGRSPAWFARRLYRGHPLLWAGLGSVVVAAACLVALSLADPAELRGEAEEPVVSPRPVPPAPADRRAEPVSNPREPEAVAHAEPPPASAAETEAVGPTVAEIWAEWSTQEHVEKAHEDEIRWRQKMQNMPGLPLGRGLSTGDTPAP